MLLELEHRLVLVSLGRCMILDMFVLVFVEEAVACMLVSWVGCTPVSDDVLVVVGCKFASSVVVPYKLVSWELSIVVFVGLYTLVSWGDYMLASFELDTLAFWEHYMLVASVVDRLVSWAPCMLALLVLYIVSLMVVRKMVESSVEHMLALEELWAFEVPCILVACMQVVEACMLVAEACMLVVLEPLESYMLDLVSVLA